MSRGKTGGTWAGLIIVALIAGIGCADRGGDSGPAGAGGELVLVDGRPLEPMDQFDAVTDTLGDGGAGEVDFDTLRIAVQNGRLILRVRTNLTLGLQTDEPLFLLVDTDNDPTTGAVPNEAGVELVWSFRQRQGVYSRGGDVHKLGHGELGIVTAPTVTSDVFEIALPLDTEIAGAPVIPGNAVGVALVYDPPEGTRERIPDAGFVTVPLADQRPAPPRLPLEKPDTAAVRLMTWNVLFDGIVERPEAFAKIMRVIRPDVAVLTEVWNTPASEAARLFNEWLPPAGGEWRAAKRDADVIALSRWPIREAWPIDSARAAAFLLEMPAHWPAPLFVIGAHAPCCAKNRERQREIDAFMGFLRDARAGLGPVTLAPNTPVVIAGDMNLVGHREQLATLVEGAIVNTDEFGPAFAPDSDGTPLADLFPRHIDDMLVYTWRDDGGSFAPGKLDYVVYGDAAIRVAHSFVFDTRLLPAEMLVALGLEADDSPEASDHLPVVADLKPVSQTVATR